MRDRVSALSDAENIKLIREGFIPVAVNDRFQRRRQDEAGRFFRKVADQGPRSGKGGSTRQGFYALTATGKLLAYRNTHDTLWFRDFLRESLKAWRSVPAEHRRLPAGGLPGLKPDPGLYHRVPDQAIVLTAHSRILNRNRSGRYLGAPVPRGDKAYGHHTAIDHVWILEEEWKTLLRQAKSAGDRQFLLPSRLAHRLALFHFWDNTRGEAVPWEKKDIRLLKIVLAPDSGSKTGGRITSFEIGGSLVLANRERRFVARLRGELQIDPKTNRPARFDFVVVGDHQGDGPFTKGSRPGFAPLGIHFFLARMKEPGDFVPPQEIRRNQRYFEAEK